MDFAAEVEANVVKGTLAAVDPAARRLVTGTGQELTYDALLVTTGAVAETPVTDAVLLNPAQPDPRLRTLINAIGDGSIHALAFVAPAPSWPLPVYELALLARERAEETGTPLELIVVTAERAPLEAFGSTVSTAVGELLAKADIRLRLGAAFEATAGGFSIRPGQENLAVDRVVAIPRLTGPRIEGLPTDPNGFLPITGHCAVAGVEGVFAAGDATDFPVKFGAIAAQQADAAAESIAALAGVEIEPAPVDSVLHGILISGRHGRLYFSARLDNGVALESRTSQSPTWSPEAKVAARHLGPYLDERWAWGPRWVIGQLAWERTLAELEAGAPDADALVGSPPADSDQHG